MLPRTNVCHVNLYYGSKIVVLDRPSTTLYQPSDLTALLHGSEPPPILFAYRHGNSGQYKQRRVSFVSAAGIRSDPDEVALLAIIKGIGSCPTRRNPDHFTLIFLVSVGRRMSDIRSPPSRPQPKYLLASLPFQLLHISPCPVAQNKRPFSHPLFNTAFS